MFASYSQNRALLRKVELALKRISTGDFGICAACGETIGLKRLKAVPWATNCIECQEQSEQGRINWAIENVTATRNSMHPVDYYPMNQEPLQPENTLTLDHEPKVEATIASLKQHFEEVRQDEIKRVRGRLGQLSSTQEHAIESLTHCIIDKILEAPITVLTGVSEDNDSFAVIETVHRVFSLNMDLDPWSEKSHRLPLWQDFENQRSSTILVNNHRQLTISWLRAAGVEGCVCAVSRKWFLLEAA
jgi:Glutamyl-tRNAGlu reductase, dimerisation domain/Prokaryotic dksA/traR C4-type zinc finger